MTAMNRKIAMVAMMMIIGAMAFAADYRLVSINRRMLDVDTYINVGICSNKADPSKAAVAIVHKSDGDGASIEIDLLMPMSEAMTIYRRYVSMPQTSVDNIIMADWSRNAAAYTYTEEDNWYQVQYDADDVVLDANMR